MSAGWATFAVALMVAAGGGGTAAGRWIAAHARRQGKVDDVLEQLTAIAADHEKRLRGHGL
jgi:hypothetical protein